MRAVASLGEGLLRLVYPNVCLGCSATATEAILPLCHRCLRHLERVDPVELAHQIERLPIPSGLIDDAFAMWRIEEGGVLRPLHHLLKYGNRPRYGVALGQIVGEAFRDRFDSPELIVPVPLHRLRVYERGYNQSSVLAYGMARVLPAALREDLLIRARATRSQTKLSREDRWANVEHAFSISKPDEIRGRYVLLVDDVLTTGATIGAAAVALRTAGAKRVSVATLAYTRM